MGLKIDRRATRITKIVGIIALVILIGCLLKILIWEHIYYQNKGAETRNPEQAVITDLADVVSPIEQKVTKEQYEKHQNGVNTPRYLEIPRLELKARIQSGELSSNIMPVPDNIYDVSWYSGSGNPGQGGNILISGISTGDAAFANLDSLENEDEIIIERGDGERFSYKVAEILIIDKDEAKDKLPVAQKRIDGKETVALVAAHRTDKNSQVFNSIIIIRAIIK